MKFKRKSAKNTRKFPNAGALKLLKKHHLPRYIRSLHTLRLVLQSGRGPQVTIALKALSQPFNDFIPPPTNGHNRDGKTSRAETHG